MLSEGTQAIAQGTVFIIKLHRFLELEFVDFSNGISGFTGVNQRPMRLLKEGKDGDFYMKQNVPNLLTSKYFANEKRLKTQVGKE